MLLPDFRVNEDLNRLKDKMGIPRDVFGVGTGYVVQNRLSTKEREDLASGVGVDVSWNDLVVLQNATFVFKGERVLIYIRDVHAFGGTENEPRYHLKTCSRIKDMHKKNRFGRYVVAQEPNGEFEIHVTRNYTKTREKRRLRVCRFCLNELAFDGFQFLRSAQSRSEFVSNFTPDRFFALYPRSPHTKVPSYGPEGAPPNDYTKDFPQISVALRDGVGWRCQQCGRLLSAAGDKKFLHVHHRNGDRWDNSPENLEAVCIGCHAEKPAHSHMKALPLYQEFRRRFP